MEDKVLQGKLVPSKELEAFIGERRPYWDPYIVCVSLGRESAFLDEVSSAIFSEDGPYFDEYFHGAHFGIDRRTSILVITCEREIMHDIAQDIMSRASAEDLIIHMAVFRHNCLGDIRETLDWSTRLLAELIHASGGNSSVGFNDFTDKKNWPGISEYVGTAH